MAADKKPVLSLGPYPCGGGSRIEGAVWDNPIEVDGRSLIVSAVSFTRSFRDESGNWKKTKNLRLQDIPVLVYMLQRAQAFLMERDKPVES